MAGLPITVPYSLFSKIKITMCAKSGTSGLVVGDGSGASASAGGCPVVVGATSGWNGVSVAAGAMNAPEGVQPTRSTSTSARAAAKRFNLTPAQERDQRPKAADQSQQDDHQSHRDVSNALRPGRFICGDLQRPGRREGRQARGRN